VRLQRTSDGLAKASQSPQNPLADFCIELGYPCLGGLRALAHCIVPRPRLSLFVLALAAKFLELAAKPLERLGVLAELVAQPFVLFTQSVLVHGRRPPFENRPGALHRSGRAQFSAAIVALRGMATGTAMRADRLRDNDAMRRRVRVIRRA
jgi:hypothetical protein